CPTRRTEAPCICSACRASWEACPAYTDESPAPPIHTYSALEALLIKAWLAGKRSSDGWMDLPTLGSALRQVQPTFSLKEHGHAALTKLVQSQTKVLEVKGTQNTLRIRLRLPYRGASQTTGDAPK
ncbi:MAG: hypothetical protein HC911_07125, partial [Chloroflexaceae bacterium]|nr:hypothetical protein [Chloroflexaceae bacterium]